jgi:outer membrane protein OmpA-like peptidoglycan-associated protein
MSKPLLYLSGLVCLLWLGAWSFWLGKKYESVSDTAAKQFSQSFNFGKDGKFSFTAETAFYFEPSSDKLSVQDDSLIFRKVTEFLSTNADQNLILTGIYTDQERNLTIHPNLGFARANVIREKLIKSGSTSDRIRCEGMKVDNLILSGGKIPCSVYFSTEDKFATRASQNQSNLEPPAKPSLKAAPAVITYLPGTYKLDVDDRRTSYLLDSLRSHLRENSSLRIIITGYSSASEQIKTQVSLAEQRAKRVRRYLIDTGVRRRQIEMIFKPSSATGNDYCKVELVIE